MKYFLAIVVCSLCVAVDSTFAEDGAAYQGSTFGQVWSAIQEKPGEVVPTARVTNPAFFFFGGRSAKADAKRTLENKFDLFAAGTEFPSDKKVAHPYGMCFRGVWDIQEASRYTGLFTKGTHVPIIVRASEASGYVKKGNLRAFGLAGKLFPGVDPDSKESLETQVSHTADFFTVDDLGGTEIDQLFESKFTNEPPVTIRLNTSPNVLALGAIFATAFNQADKNPGVRQLYPLSESGMQAGKGVTPSHLRLVGGDFGRIQPIGDFRSESRLANYSKPVVLQIEVRASAQDAWEPMGSLHLEEDVISKACDETLHFHHPKWRP